MKPLVWTAERRARIRRLLVIRRKGLGDALVTLPALVRLVEAFPAARLDLVMDRPFAALIEGLAEPVDVLTWPAPGVNWLRQLRSANYEIVVDYLGSPRTAIWTALSGAQLRVGYEFGARRYAYNVRVPRNRSGDFALRQYAGEAFLDPLRALGLPVRPWQPAAALNLDPSALGRGYRDWRARWSQRSSPRIVLMFSATWSAKSWPAREAGRLYEQLARRGASCVVAPGPGDEPWLAELRGYRPEIPCAPETNLLELADLLSDSDLFVGTDCGARHLAACLGLPTVTLFGPTDARTWNPEDPRHVSVQTGESCSPCDLTQCPLPDHPCLSKLSAEMVVSAVERLLPRVGSILAPASGD